MWTDNINRYLYMDSEIVKYSPFYNDNLFIIHDSYLMKKTTFISSIIEMTVYNTGFNYFKQ